jgi:hypothetical protein
LWKGKQQPKLDALDRICEALGDCSLDELITRTAEKRERPHPRKNGLQEEIGIVKCCLADQNLDKHCVDRIRDWRVGSDMLLGGRARITLRRNRNITG